MSDATDRLALPFIAPAQAQKHVTHNEALLRLDALLHAAVRSRTLGFPPASPAEGDSYLVAPAPSGAWVGQAGRFAVARGVEWDFLDPPAGMVVFAADENRFLGFDGSVWAALGANGGTLLADRLGVNCPADPAARLAVASPTTLVSHDPGVSGDARLNVNKAASGATASLVFQTGWSGRAEMGLAGSDDFAVKVSADGGAWRVALTVAAASGNIGIGTAAPTASLHVAGAARVGSFTVASVPSASALGAGAIVYVSNEAGGGTLAVSDGGVWRRVQDRAPIS